MDISRWPIGDIMQLPDDVFGNRFIVACAGKPGGEATVWDISEVALPEHCVIWELYLGMELGTVSRAVFRLGIGDQLPTTEAIMDQTTPVFPGLGGQGAEPRDITLKDSTQLHLCRLKHYIHSMGRRLVVQFENTGSSAINMNAIIVVSALPRSIPKWLD